MSAEADVVAAGGEALQHRVFQTITEAPHGNALAACAASLLGLSIDDVPNFVALDDYWAGMVAHAAEHEQQLCKVVLQDGCLPYATAPGRLCMARGKSPRGDHGHVIVAAVDADGRSLEHVHDPFPAGGFLDGVALWAAFYAPAAVSGPALDAVEGQLREDGLDVFQPFRVGWYNDYIRSKGLATDEDHVGGAAFSLAPLPDFGRHGDALALLVGNSRGLWPKLVSWLKEDPDRILANPVDTYSNMAINRAIADYAGDTQYDIFWASDMSPERLVDMNRSALVSALCHFSEEMYLSVHPKFGSWVAFRAVVVLDLPATHLGGPPSLVPSPLSEDEVAAVREAFAAALQASSEADMTCDGMPLEIAHKWAAMRGCVRLGVEYRYSDLQSEYHYTKSPECLRRALEEGGLEDDDIVIE